MEIGDQQLLVFINSLFSIQVLDIWAGDMPHPHCAESFFLPVLWQRQMWTDIFGALISLKGTPSSLDTASWMYP